MHGLPVGLPDRRRHPGAARRRGTHPRLTPAGRVGGGRKGTRGTTVGLDEQLLDDAEGLAAADPSGSLRALASAGAQVRRALTATEEARIHGIVRDGRPRAVVVASLGGSAVVGDVLDDARRHRSPGAGVRAPWAAAAGLGGAARPRRRGVDVGAGAGSGRARRRGGPPRRPAADRGQPARRSPRSPSRPAACTSRCPRR